MKILFTVQGEGRGHMTQAMAVQEILRHHGHQVIAVLAGGNPSRSLPSFFEQAFDVPVRRMASPGFAQSKNRGISLLGSGAELLKNFGPYRSSLSTIDQTITQTQPDLILNFLEPLMGVYNLLKRPKVPTLAVGHQFMTGHPSYVRVKEFPFQRIGMGNYVAITGARSSRLALSFYPAENLPNRQLTVCPPILRRQLFQLTPTPGERLLVYLVFHGFSQDIIEWSQAHPETPIDCFYDKPNCPPVENYSSSLTFHKLDGEKFLTFMARSRAVVCTAGFESVSEAAYLGKKLLMVPVENHLEQFVNARDAEQTGLGIHETKFALSRVLTEFACQPRFDFNNWIDQAENIILQAIAEAASKRGANSAQPQPAAPQFSKHPSTL